MNPLEEVEGLKTKSTTEAILWYGLFAVVIGGGAGVWLPLLIPGKSLAPDGLATYIFAVLAPLLADAVLHEPYWKDLSKAVRMKIVGSCGIAGALALIALVRGGQTGDWTAGLVGAVVALVVWFFIAKFSHRFEPDTGTNPTGSFGGPNVSSTKLSGSGLK